MIEQTRELSLLHRSAAEILGRNLNCIQGPQTSRDAVSRMMSCAHNQESLHGITLVNYDSGGRAFQHVIDMDTVRSNGRVSALVAVSREVRLQEFTAEVEKSSGLDALCPDSSDDEGLLDGEVLLEMMSHTALPESPSDEIETWDDEIEAVLYSWERVSMKCSLPGRKDNRQAALV